MTVKMIMMNYFPGARMSGEKMHTVIQSVIDPCKGPNPPAYIRTIYWIKIQAPADQEPEVEEEDEIINYRLMADGGRAALAEGGMPYEGGIMDLESARQMYGLGKLVKKITRGVKKIAKSPIGKAALLYAVW